MAAPLQPDRQLRRLGPKAVILGPLVRGQFHIEQARLRLISPFARHVQACHMAADDKPALKDLAEDGTVETIENHLHPIRARFVMGDHRGHRRQALDDRADETSAGFGQRRKRAKRQLLDPRRGVETRGSQFVGRNLHVRKAGSGEVGPHFRRIESGEIAVLVPCGARLGNPAVERRRHRLGPVLGDVRPAGQHQHLAVHPKLPGGFVELAPPQSIGHWFPGTRRHRFQILRTVDDRFFSGKAGDRHGTFGRGVQVGQRERLVIVPGAQNQCIAGLQRACGSLQSAKRLILGAGMRVVARGGHVVGVSRRLRRGGVE